MLWGDEVCLLSCQTARTTSKDRADRHEQVEYLVVTYDKDDPHVLLSLRQADILKALAEDQELSEKGGCVPDLQNVDQQE